VQTVDVVGESWIYGGETQNVTALSVGSATFASNTKLILGASEAGPHTGSEPKGAGSYLVGGSVEMAGELEAQVSDPQWNDRIKVTDLTVEPGGSVLAASGVLRFIQEGEGGYPWAATNEGTFTVDAGASVDMEPSFSGKAVFVNDGSVVNGGSIALHGAEWTQSGGSLSGGAVVLQSGSSLADSAGAGAFLFDYGSVALTGTVPAGQTVKVLGAPYGYGGETYFESELNLAGRELVNRGTLVFEAPGSGETGGSVNVEGGSIANDGTIDASAESTSRRVQLLATITNTTGGQINIENGVFDVNGASTSNAGLLTVSPGAVYRIEENGILTNSGTISPKIASATSYGLVQLNSPCCHGAGRFVAGGILKPVLTSGFLPAKRQEFDLFQFGGSFTGEFAKVTNGFAGDYAHEGSGYVGAIYHLPAPPEFGRCVKVAKGTGEFKTAACDSLEAGGSYEWVAGTEAARSHFSAAGGSATLESVGHAKVVCSAVSGSGEFSGTREFDDVVLRFTGCEGLGHKCTSPSASEGELVSGALEGELGWEAEAKHKVALALQAPSGAMLSFSCGGEAVTVTGSVLGSIKADGAPSLASKVVYKAAKGKQKPEGFEGGAKAVLSSTFGAGSAEQTGLTLKLTLTGEEKLEVNATT